ncbi:hypothetical protein P7K49_016975 [Saguinus oedipus]|uniref:BCL2 interacting protein 2 n=1 Tax=Saguinus oedipus TaxID=9490 RepID=A0ABQ9V291_SAGOE|nr:hypothetical protein P7K49_016975 [Saguinus oedipus]
MTDRFLQTELELDYHKSVLLRSSGITRSLKLSATKSGITGLFCMKLPVHCRQCAMLEANLSLTATEGLTTMKSVSHFVHFSLFRLLLDTGPLDYQECVVDIESRLRMEGVELKEEWQDEDFPIPLPEDDSTEADILAITGPGNQPGSLEVNENKGRKKLMAPDISLTLDPSDGSVLSDDLDESGEIDLDGLDTPSENSNEFEWEDDLPKPKTTEVIRKGSITEYTAAEEKEDGRRWRMFRIGEQDHRVDMKAIEPYKKVISHGGYGKI